MMSSLGRHGGIFHGPRLIIALFAVTVLFFYLKQPSNRTAAIVSSYSNHAAQPGRLDHGGDPEGGAFDAAHMAEPESHGSEQQSIPDRLFDYLKEHAKLLVSGGKGRSSGCHADNMVNGVHSLDQAFPNDTTPRPAYETICAHVTDVEDVLLVVRVAASDLYSRLPSQMLTYLRCVDHLLFSTVSHELGGYIVHDGLANVSASTKATQKDFELYRKQAESQKAGMLEGEALEEDGDHNLAKWGMIPTILAAYKMRPQKKWFMIVEADTYVSLPNLGSWIKQLHASDPVYAGAQVLINDVELAHSGSGILLSSAALQKLDEVAPRRTLAWEQAVSQSCCGDLVLAQALQEVNVTLHRSFPLLQGETLFSLDWSTRHWCKAAVTWHGMQPEGMFALWHAEQTWRASQQQKELSSSSDNVSNGTEPAGTLSPPLLYKHLFQQLVVDALRARPNRTRWDNLANSYTYTDGSRAQYAHFSAEACRAACDLREECLQYAWEPNKCRLGSVVRVGEPVRVGEREHGGDRDRMVSGWLVPRVERWVKTQESACDGESPWILPGNEGAEEMADIGAMVEPPSMTG